MTARIIPIAEGHRIRAARSQEREVRASDFAALGMVCFWPLAFAWSAGLAVIEGMRGGQGR